MGCAVARSTSGIPGIDPTAAAWAAPRPLPTVTLALSAAPRPLGTFACLLAVTWILVWGADRPVAAAWAVLRLRVIILKPKEVLLFLMENTKNTT